MIELEALNWSFQLLLYIYDMISGMSRADVKNFSSCVQILLFRESSLIHNAEFTVDLSPVPNAHSPFFSGFESCQIQGFQECCITWKYASLTVELTVGRIQTFDCICRVNNLSDIRRELENRCYCIPVIIPAFHGIRVFCGPFFSNTLQSQSGFFFIGRMVNRF